MKHAKTMMAQTPAGRGIAPLGRVPVGTSSHLQVSGTGIQRVQIMATEGICVCPFAGWGSAGGSGHDRTTGLSGSNR